MNIQTAEFPLRYRYVATVTPDGTEYRHCYSTQPVGNFGFAIWHEHTDGAVLVTDAPEFVQSRKSAKNLVHEWSDEFRRSLPHCTYQQVLVLRTAFATSMINEEYRTLRRWVSMQGLTNSDFVITPHHRLWKLSFRTMDSRVEHMIALLRLSGVLEVHRCGAFVIEHDGRLEDFMHYRG